MIARTLGWTAAALVAWLVLASMLFLWMSGLLYDPHIGRWTRFWQWIVYARLFGRSVTEMVYLAVSAMIAAAPFIVFVRLAGPRFHPFGWPLAASSGEQPTTTDTQTGWR